MESWRGAKGHLGKVCKGINYEPIKCVTSSKGVVFLQVQSLELTPVSVQALIPNQLFPSWLSHAWVRQEYSKLLNPWNDTALRWQWHLTAVRKYKEKETHPLQLSVRKVVIYSQTFSTVYQFPDHGLSSSLWQLDLYWTFFLCSVYIIYVHNLIDILSTGYQASQTT